MSTYPVVYDHTPAVDRSRLTVFFRFIMVIPHLIWSMFHGIGAFVVTFLAWFAIIFTGRYPEGMYDFVAGSVRFYARFTGYMFLITDEYPRSTAASTPSTPCR